MMLEKDFGMYIGDKTPVETPAQVPAPAGETPIPATDPVTDLEAIAAEVPVVPEGESKPAPAGEVPPAGDVTPAGETPPEGETPAPAGETPAPEVTGDELQKMLDSLDSAGTETTADIKTAVEEAKATLPEADVETKKLLDEALTKIAELEASKLKDQKTIEVIKNEYEKTLGDKISLEYGTASDSKIASMVNEDPDVKMLIAAKLATGDDAKEKLSQARKAGRENISGTTIDSLITAKKDAETTALGGGEDVGATAGTPEKSMYL